MIKITDLKGLFNITQNPDHEDWLDISFKEDFLIPDIDTDFSMKSVLRVEMDNEYEEVFIEGAYRNNIEYDIHFGTIIVEDKERTLNMYYSTIYSINNGYLIPAGEVHSHIYMAIKNFNRNNIKFGGFLIVDNDDVVKSVDMAIELPSNEEYIRIKTNG